MYCRGGTDTDTDHHSDKQITPVTLTPAPSGHRSCLSLANDNLDLGDYRHGQPGMSPRGNTPGVPTQKRAETRDVASRTNFSVVVAPLRVGHTKIFCFTTI